MVEPQALTDEELHEHLVKFGVNVPVTPSSRKPAERRLRKLMENAEKNAPKESTPVRQVERELSPRADLNGASEELPSVRAFSHEPSPHERSPLPSNGDEYEHEEEVDFEGTTFARKPTAEESARFRESFGSYTAQPNPQRVGYPRLAALIWPLGSVLFVIGFYYFFFIHFKAPPHYHRDEI